MQKYRTELWTEYTYGEGPSCYCCHVKIPSSYHHLLDPISESEKIGLADVWQSEATATSRLACQIKLDRKHDGIVVFVPDSIPTDLM